MESINSFMVQPEFERTLRADQIFDPGQRNDGLHLLPFPIKESDAEFIDLLCKLPQRVACHPKSEPWASKRRTLLTGSYSAVVTSASSCVPSGW